jgi:hypothetical protein
MARAPRARSAILVIVLVAAVVGRASLAAALLVAFVARTLFAVLAAFLAPALPDRIRQRLNSLRWLIRIVARNDNLGATRNAFIRPVADDNAEAGTRMKCCREWIVDQSPVLRFFLEGNAADVQHALADIADGYGSLRRAAGDDPPEAQRPCYRQFAGRGEAGHV